VYAAIDALERTPRTIERFEQRQERFAGFVAPGLLLIAAEMLLRATLFRRIP
jgi:hypothetical protein